MPEPRQNSVLFSIGSVIELQHTKEQERQAELARKQAEAERAESDRIERARRAAEQAEQDRLAAAADAARAERERDIAAREEAIRKQVEADTALALEQLRAEYRNGAPLVIPGQRRLRVVMATLATLAVVGLGAFGAYAARGNDRPSVAPDVAALANAPAAAVPAPTADPEAERPVPMPTVREATAEPTLLAKTPTRVKPRPVARSPRCRWVTVTKRVQNPLWNHPLNFEGRYKIIKKRVKRCRK